LFRMIMKRDWRSATLLPKQMRRIKAEFEQNED
jgi:hypothetical protein